MLLLLASAILFIWTSSFSSTSLSLSPSFSLSQLICSARVRVVWNHKAFVQHAMRCPGTILCSALNSSDEWISGKIPHQTYTHCTALHCATGNRQVTRTSYTVALIRALRHQLPLSKTCGHFNIHTNNLTVASATGAALMLAFKKANQTTQGLPPTQENTDTYTAYRQKQHTPRYFSFIQNGKNTNLNCFPRPRSQHDEREMSESSQQQKSTNVLDSQLCCAKYNIQTHAVCGNGQALSAPHLSEARPTKSIAAVASAKTM